MSGDAFHITGPAENGEGGAAAMKNALNDASLNPDDVGYLNAHGTSTPLGDVAETKGVKSVFGEDGGPEGEISYVAASNTDQQYLVRVSNFLEMFLLECKDEQFLRWVNNFCTTIIKKATQTPRVCKLYSLLKVAMQICARHSYFVFER